MTIQSSLQSKPGTKIIEQNSASGEIKEVPKCSMVYKSGSIRASQSQLFKLSESMESLVIKEVENNEKSNIASSRSVVLVLMSQKKGVESAQRFFICVYARRRLDCTELVRVIEIPPNVIYLNDPNTGEQKFFEPKELVYDESCPEMIFVLCSKAPQPELVGSVGCAQAIVISLSASLNIDCRAIDLGLPGSSRVAAFTRVVTGFSSSLNKQDEERRRPWIFSLSQDGTVSCFALESGTVSFVHKLVDVTSSPFAALAATEVVPDLGVNAVQICAVRDDGTNTSFFAEIKNGVMEITTSQASNDADLEALTLQELKNLHSELQWEFLRFQAFGPPQGRTRLIQEHQGSTLRWRTRNRIAAIGSEEASTTISNSSPTVSGTTDDLTFEFDMGQICAIGCLEMKVDLQLRQSTLPHPALFFADKPHIRPCIQIETDSSLANLLSFTIETWVKVASSSASTTTPQEEGKKASSGRKIILAKKNTHISCGDKPQYEISVTENGHLHFALWGESDSDSSPSLKVSSFQQKPGGESSSSRIDLRDGEWHHVAAILERGQHAEIFVDGEFIGSVDNNTKSSNSSSFLRVDRGEAEEPSTGSRSLSSFSSSPGETKPENGAKVTRFGSITIGGADANETTSVASETEIVGHYLRHTRIWAIARSQQQIRDWMHHRVVNDRPQEITSRQISLPSFDETQVKPKLASTENDSSIRSSGKGVLLLFPAAAGLIASLPFEEEGSSVLDGRVSTVKMHRLSLWGSSIAVSSAPVIVLPSTATLDQESKKTTPSTEGVLEVSWKNSPVPVMDYVPKLDLSVQLFSDQPSSQVFEDKVIDRIPLRSCVSSHNLGAVLGRRVVICLHQGVRSQEGFENGESSHLESISALSIRISGRPKIRLPVSSAGATTLERGLPVVTPMSVLSSLSAKWARLCSPELGRQLVDIVAPQIENSPSVTRGMQHTALLLLLDRANAGYIWNDPTAEQLKSLLMLNIINHSDDSSDHIENTVALISKMLLEPKELSNLRSTFSEVLLDMLPTACNNAQTARGLEVFMDLVSLCWPDDSAESVRRKALSRIVQELGLLGKILEKKDSIYHGVLRTCFGIFSRPLEDAFKGVRADIESLLFLGQSVGQGGSVGGVISIKTSTASSSGSSKKVSEKKDSSENKSSSASCLTFTLNGLDLSSSVRRLLSNRDFESRSGTSTTMDFLFKSAPWISSSPRAKLMASKSAGARVPAFKYVRIHSKTTNAMVELIVPDSSTIGKATKGSVSQTEGSTEGSKTLSIKFTEMQRPEDSVVILDLGRSCLIRRAAAIPTLEGFSSTTGALVSVEAWQEQPKPASPPVILCTRDDFEVQLHAFCGQFTFDKDGVIGTKSTFPTVVPRGVAIHSGKWYYEVVLVKTENGVAQLGWSDDLSTADDTKSGATGCGDDEHSWAYDGNRIKKWSGHSETWGKKWKDNDIVGCAIDIESREVSFSLNGSFKKPMGVAFTDINISGGVFPAMTGERSFKFKMNLGQEPLQHKPPSGFRPVFEWILENKNTSEMFRKTDSSLKKRQATKPILFQSIPKGTGEIPKGAPDLRADGHWHARYIKICVSCQQWWDAFSPSGYYEGSLFKGHRDDKSDIENDLKVLAAPPASEEGKKDETAVDSTTTVAATEASSASAADLPSSSVASTPPAIHNAFTFPDASKFKSYSQWTDFSNSKKKVTSSKVDLTITLSLEGVHGTILDDFEEQEDHLAMLEEERTNSVIELIKASAALTFVRSELILALERFFGDVGANGFPWGNGHFEDEFGTTLHRFVETSVSADASSKDDSMEENESKLNEITKPLLNRLLGMNSLHQSAKAVIDAAVEATRLNLGKVRAGCERVKMYDHLLEEAEELAGLSKEESLRRKEARAKAVKILEQEYIQLLPLTGRQAWNGLEQQLSPNGDFRIDSSRKYLAAELLTKILLAKLRTEIILEENENVDVSQGDQETLTLIPMSHLDDIFKQFCVFRPYSIRHRHDAGEIILLALRCRNMQPTIVADFVVNNIEDLFSSPIAFGSSALRGFPEHNVFGLLEKLVIGTKDTSKSTVEACIKRLHKLLADCMASTTSDDDIDGALRSKLPLIGWSLMLLSHALEKEIFVLADWIEASQIREEGGVIDSAVTSIMNFDSSSLFRHYEQKLKPTAGGTIKSIHRNCVCSGCEARPIVGDRYRCVNVANFDLCEKCEEEGRYPDPSFVFLKISRPLPLPPSSDLPRRIPAGPVLPDLMTMPPSKTPSLPAKEEAKIVPTEQSSAIAPKSVISEANTTNGDQSGSDKNELNDAELSEATKIIHKGTTCDSCKISPIVGIRYKCVNCVEFNLCQDCEMKGVVNSHPPLHVFCKLRRELAPQSKPSDQKSEGAPLIPDQALLPVLLHPHLYPSTSSVAESVIPIVRSSAGGVSGSSRMLSLEGGAPKNPLKLGRSASYVLGASGNWGMPLINPSAALAVSEEANRATLSSSSRSPRAQFDNRSNFDDTLPESPQSLKLDMALTVQTIFSLLSSGAFLAPLQLELFLVCARVLTQLISRAQIAGMLATTNAKNNPTVEIVSVFLSHPKFDTLLLASASCAEPMVQNTVLRLMEKLCSCSPIARKVVRERCFSVLNPSTSALVAPLLEPSLLVEIIMISLSHSSEGDDGSFSKREGASDATEPLPLRKAHSAPIRTFESAEDPNLTNPNVEKLHPRHTTKILDYFDSSPLSSTSIARAWALCFRILCRHSDQDAMLRGSGKQKFHDAIQNVLSAGWAMVSIIERDLVDLVVLLLRSSSVSTEARIALQKGLVETLVDSFHAAEPVNHRLFRRLISVVHASLCDSPNPAAAVDAKCILKLLAGVSCALSSETHTILASSSSATVATMAAANTAANAFGDSPLFDDVEILYKVICLVSESTRIEVGEGNESEDDESSMTPQSLRRVVLKKIIRPNSGAPSIAQGLLSWLANPPNVVENMRVSYRRLSGALIFLFSDIFARSGEDDGAILLDICLAILRDPKTTSPSSIATILRSMVSFEPLANHLVNRLCAQELLSSKITVGRREYSFEMSSSSAALCRSLSTTVSLPKLSSERGQKSELKSKAFGDIPSEQIGLLQNAEVSTALQPTPLAVIAASLEDDVGGYYHFRDLVSIAKVGTEVEGAAKRGATEAGKKQTGESNAIPKGLITLLEESFTIPKATSSASTSEKSTGSIVEQNFSDGKCVWIITFRLSKDVRLSSFQMEFLEGFTLSNKNSRSVLPSRVVVNVGTSLERLTCAGTALVPVALTKGDRNISTVKVSLTGTGAAEFIQVLVFAPPIVLAFADHDFNVSGTGKKRLSVAAAHLKIGDEVVRGPSWKYESQDGGPGSIGTVVAITSWRDVPNKGVKVSWPSGSVGIYRFGFIEEEESGFVPQYDVRLALEKSSNLGATVALSSISALASPLTPVQQSPGFASTLAQNNETGSLPLMLELLSMASSRFTSARQILTSAENTNSGRFIIVPVLMRHLVNNQESSVHARDILTMLARENLSVMRHVLKSILDIDGGQEISTLTPSHAALVAELLCTLPIGSNQFNSEEDFAVLLWRFVLNVLERSNGVGSSVQKDHQWQQLHLFSMLPFLRSLAVVLEDRIHRNCDIQVWFDQTGVIDDETVPKQGSTHVVQLLIDTAEKSVVGSPTEEASLSLLCTALRASAELRKAALKEFSNRLVSPLESGAQWSGAIESSLRVFGVACSCHPDMLSTTRTNTGGHRTLQSIADLCLSIYDKSKKHNDSLSASSPADVVETCVLALADASFSRSVKKWLLESGVLERLIQEAFTVSGVTSFAVQRAVLDLVSKTVNMHQPSQDLVARMIVGKMQQGKVPENGEEEEAPLRSTESEQQGNDSFLISLLAKSASLENKVVIAAWKPRIAIDRILRLSSSSSSLIGISADGTENETKNELFHLDSKACSSAIELSSSGLSATQVGSESWGMVRADTEIPFSGVSKWDVMIETSPMGHIFLGVATHQSNLFSYLGNDKFGWGYIGNSATWHNKTKEKTYGKNFRTGDVISVTIDMDAGTMSFAKNKEDMGIAFEGLSGKTLFPAFALYQKDDRITIIRCSMARVKQQKVAKSGDMTDSISFEAEKLPRAQQPPDALIPVEASDVLSRLRFHRTCPAFSQSADVPLSALLKQLEKEVGGEHNNKNEPKESGNEGSSKPHWRVLKTFEDGSEDEPLSRFIDDSDVVDVIFDSATNANLSFPKATLAATISSSSTSVLLNIARMHGLPKLVNLVSNKIGTAECREMLARESMDIRLVSQWVSFLQDCVTISGFAEALVQDKNCIGLLLKIVGINVRTWPEVSRVRVEPSASALKDPPGTLVSAVGNLFDILKKEAKAETAKSNAETERPAQAQEEETVGEESKTTEDAPQIRQAKPFVGRAWVDALKGGVIDRLIHRLGELQSEKPRKPARLQRFEWKKQEDKQQQKVLDMEKLDDETSTPSSENETSENKKELWKPGYGVGEVDNTKSEIETALLQKAREERTIQTALCLISILDIPNEIASSLPDDFWADLLDCLESSSILRVFMSAFFGNTVKVILDKPLVYSAFLRLVIVLAQQPRLTPVLDSQEDMYRSVSQLMTGMDELSEELLDAKEEGEEEAEGKTHTKSDTADNDEKSEKKTETAASQSPKETDSLKPLSEYSNDEIIARDWRISDLGSISQLTNDRALFALIKIALKETERSLARYKEEQEAKKKEEDAKEEAAASPKKKSSKKGDEEGDDDEESSASPKPRVAAGNALELIYEEKLGPELFKDMDLAGSDGTFKNHFFSSDILSDLKSKVSKTRFKRLNREFKSLKRSLPLHFGSTIAVRIDKTRNFVAQAMIMAPHNTPYDSGCFLFDVYFPPEYPDEPMKVNLATTGNGSVRFNPNLYNTGKVCLSLLGTWRGGATGNENWTKNSTFWQVLVSIQSAILGSEFPYFNEPGIEAQWGTEQGNLQRRINSNGGYERLRVGTVQWAMTAQIKSPPPGFEDVVRQHFLLKRKHILNVVNGWLEEAKVSDTKTQFSTLDAVSNDLKAALAELGPSPCDEETVLLSAPDTATAEASSSTNTAKPATEDESGEITSQAATSSSSTTTTEKETSE